MPAIASLSRRGQEAPSSPIRSLGGLVQAAKARGITVHELNIGQPDIATPRGMIDAYRNFNDRVLAYAPSDGFPEYREALATKYYYRIVGDQPPITKEDIVVTTGGSEALLFAMAAVTDPGEEILVCEPYYTNYFGYAHLLGVETSPVTTHVEAHYQIDPKHVEAAITGKTRALVLPTPGNPTGVVLSREDLHALSDICKRHGLYFIADEVYREFVYDADPGTLAPSLLSIEGMEDHAIVIDSVSKRYSACGARIGCLITRNKDVRSAVMRMAEARLSPATVDQYAGMAALDTPPEYFRNVVVEYQHRRDTLVSGLADIGISIPAPKGAFYLAVPLPVDDSNDFAHWLLTDFDLDGRTVCVAPLAGFYSTPGMGKSEIRMAYVLESPVLKDCVKILDAGIKAYNSK